ncbi:redoxin domain-containing protein [Pseudenhygromyxa sp. WMMC2535]|uniref:peroxiredoxin family protein n=1 Tax=Pseudenhygromyxa sp. WMMC2535 TaxID=2712867 RepID=UPI0015576B91|nr:redoxin domain-containing protein [Pseudenhygromyxa sp. WMMC2535]NVB40606.1 redoxin domain-containing protein [Pseudenhygromyxa sp. WMMC2535]
MAERSAVHRARRGRPLAWTPGPRAARRGAALALALALLGPGCRSSAEPAPAKPPKARSDEARVEILDPRYGASPAHPEALAPGDRWQLPALETVDGVTMALDTLVEAGPVTLVWVGAAEHAQTSEWVVSLAAGLADFDARGTTLVFARSLPRASALRWAGELRLQAPVLADEAGALTEALGLGAAPELGFAVWVLAEDRTLRYRKLGGRRPGLDELLAVLDGQAEGWRCCPDTCPKAARDEPCTQR